MLPSMLSVIIMAISPLLCSGLQGSAVQPATLKVSSSTFVVDTVLFNGEQDMYALRVNELSPVVDVFMVFEGVCTFTAKPKEPIFDQSDKRFGAASEKIVYRKAPCFNSTEAWDNEHSMRHFILDTIKTDMHSIAGPSWVNGAVMISDVDEIPMAKKLHYVFQQPSFWQSNKWQVYRVRGQMYMYNIRCLETVRSTTDWKGTHIFSGHMIDMDHAFDLVRARRTKANISNELVDEVEVRTEANLWDEFVGELEVGPFVDLHESAWHLSFFLSPEDIQKKMNAYSHQKLNKPEFRDLEKIKGRQNACVDPFDRIQQYPTYKLKESELTESETRRVPQWLIEAASDGRLPKQWLTGVYD